MLRSVRRKLKQIRYYSAPRPQPGWSRATDIALVASFFLALPATWLCDLMVMRSSAAINHSGQVFRLNNGAYAAILFSSNRAWFKASEGLAVGMFQMQVEDRQQGWPLVTSIQRQPVRLDVDLRDEPQPRTNVTLAPDDPLREAIVAALELDEQHETIAAWTADTGGSPATRYPMAWFMGSGLWWMLLTFTSFVCIQLARAGWMVVLARQVKRETKLLSEGKCLTCGYDLRGLDFNERCPECGDIVW